MGKVAGKVFFKAKMFSRFLSRSSQRRCTCRSVQIGATFRFRDEETSFARSHATFASPPEYRALPVCRTNVQSIIGASSLQCLACIAIYRVAVGFTSRRISKGPRSAFHSRRYYILPRWLRAMAARQFSRLHFQLRNVPAIDIYPAGLL